MIARPTEARQQFLLSATTPVGDEGNATIKLDGALGATFECTAASSATGTVETQHHDGGDWEQVASWEFVSGVATPRAAGVTITLTDNDRLFVPCPGMFAVRFNLGGTSATVYGRSCESLTDFLLQVLISQNAAGGGASTTPYVAVRAVTLTFSTDTSIYADNDVLADSQILASAFRANDAKGFLVEVALLDEDDNTPIDMDMVFLKANVSLGTENAAVSISDANARNIIHTIHILAADWDDLINSKQVTLGGRNSMMSIPLEPVSGTDDIYVGLIVRSGTPTYTASGLTAIFYFIDAL